MLNPEQLRLRLRDSELRKLKQENERLRDQIKDIKSGFVGLLKALAARASMFERMEIEKMIKELRGDGSV